MTTNDLSVSTTHAKPDRPCLTSPVQSPLGDNGKEVNRNMLPGLAIATLSSKAAAQLVVAKHYLHRRPPISHAFGLYLHGKLLGVVTYGTPASRHLQKSACPTDPGKVIELNRLWLDDALPANSESWFVSRTLKMLPPPDRRLLRRPPPRALRLHLPGAQLPVRRVD